MSTDTVEAAKPSTKVEAVAMNKGDRLVAYVRIVNNEGEDLNYTCHVLMNLPSGREEKYSETIFLRDGCSCGLAVNLYPKAEKSADVRIRIYKEAAVEPFEDVTFHFALTTVSVNSKSQDSRDKGLA